jgi:hypothetical protein
VRCARVADGALTWILQVWGDVPRTSVEAEPDVEGAQSEREQAGRAVSHGDRRSSRESRPLSYHWFVLSPEVRNTTCVWRPWISAVTPVRDLLLKAYVPPISL